MTSLCCLWARLTEASTIQFWDRGAVGQEEREKFLVPVFSSFFTLALWLGRGHVRAQKLLPAFPQASPCVSHECATYRRYLSAGSTESASHAGAMCRTAQRRVPSGAWTGHVAIARHCGTPLCRASNRTSSAGTGGQHRQHLQFSASFRHSCLSAAPVGRWSGMWVGLIYVLLYLVLCTQARIPPCAWTCQQHGPRVHPAIPKRARVRGRYRGMGGT